MTDFQAAASRQGRAFEDLVAATLTFFDWTITGRRVLLHGVEVDIVATDPGGQEWLIECKGSHRGLRPGATRSDTVKKAVADAWHLAAVGNTTPCMLVVSHSPKPSSSAARLLDRAVEHGLFAAVKSIDFTTRATDDDDGEGDTP